MGMSRISSKCVIRSVFFILKTSGMKTPGVPICRRYNKEDKFFALICDSFNQSIFRSSRKGWYKHQRKYRLMMSMNKWQKPSLFNTFTLGKSLTCRMNITYILKMKIIGNQSKGTYSFCFDMQGTFYLNSFCGTLFRIQNTYIP